MANVATSVDVQPNQQPESAATGVRASVRVRSNPDAPTEELEVLSEFILDEPVAPRALLLPALPPLPATANPHALLQQELDRVSRLHREQRAYVSELQTVLSRRSQELLEADEREAALVRRFHRQTLRIAELDRQVREQQTLIEQLQAALPKRPSEVSELLSIRGIGPKYARTLSALGLRTVTALASLTEDDVRRIEQQLRIRNGRIRRERWVEQARELASLVPQRPAAGPAAAELAEAAAMSTEA